MIFIYLGRDDFSPSLVMRRIFQISIFEIFDSQITKTCSHFLTSYVINS